MNAEVVAIGDEITSGQLLDTNSQWLSLRLEELGIRVLYHSTVGDEMEPIVGVFRRAVERADVVLVTGGLGPTDDDLTRQALAEAAGRSLVQDPQSLEYIRQLFARRQRPMPVQNEIQAMFPEGSRVIPNPHGTAPGIDLEVPRPGRSPSRVFVLPGVPAEMREMWQQTVDGRLREMGADRRVIRHRRIKCFGAGESHIESMLPGLIRRGRTPRVGINASQATIILRITAEGASDEECLAAMQPTVGLIYQALGSLVFGEEDDELQHAVLRWLGNQHKTLATVEWGTAGLIADWLGAASDPAGRYVGGVVVRDDASLARTLDLSAELISRHGPSSPEVLTAAAAACRTRFGADYALAVGPFPPFDPAAAQPKPVLFALAGAEGASVKSMPFAGHPALLRALFAKHALNLVRLAIQVKA